MKFKYRRSKKFLGVARVTVTQKRVSVSASSPKARRKKSATNKGEPKASSPINKPRSPIPATKKVALPSRGSTVAIEGEVPAEWRQGSGAFEGLFWNGKKWVKVSSNTPEPSADLSARSEGLPEGWLRGSGAFAGQIWNGKKWIPATNGS